MHSPTYCQQELLSMLQNMPQAPIPLSMLKKFIAKMEATLSGFDISRYAGEIINHEEIKRWLASSKKQGALNKLVDNYFGSAVLFEYDCNLLKIITMSFYQNRNLIVKGESPETGNIWLGDYESARAKRSLKADKINAVVTAGLGMKVSYGSEFKHKMLPLYDSEREDILRFFNSSYDFIEEALKSGNVLVHCYAGVSRSTTILTAYLMRKSKTGYRETLAMIKKIRPVIGPNRGFIAQLRKFEAALNGDPQSQTFTQKGLINKSVDIIKKTQNKSKSFVEGFLSFKKELNPKTKPASITQVKIPFPGRSKTINKEIAVST